MRVQTQVEPNRGTLPSWLFLVLTSFLLIICFLEPIHSQQHSSFFVHRTRASPSSLCLTQTFCRPPRTSPPSVPHCGASFWVVPELNILDIYQLARYPERVVHFFRCPVSCRLYDMLFRDHSVCYVSSYFILCIRYDNWGSFDSLEVIYAVLSLMIILLLNVTSRIRFPPDYSLFFDCTNLRDSYWWIEAPSNDKSSTNCSRYLSIPSSILVDRANSHLSFSLSIFCWVWHTSLKVSHWLPLSWRHIKRISVNELRIDSNFLITPLRRTVNLSWVRTSSAKIPILSVVIFFHYSGQWRRSEIVKESVVVDDRHFVRIYFSKDRHLIPIVDHTSSKYPWFVLMTDVIPFFYTRSVVWRYETFTRTTTTNLLLQSVLKRTRISTIQRADTVNE